MSNYLIHWKTQRDAQERQGHKYIARIWTNSTWRYFYDAKSLAAFQKKADRRGEKTSVQYSDGHGGWKAPSTGNVQLDRKVASARSRAHSAVDAGKKAVGDVMNALGLVGITKKDPATLREKRDADTAARLEKYKKQIQRVEARKAREQAALEARKAERAKNKKERATIPEEEDGKKKGSGGGGGGGGSGKKGSGAAASNPNAVGALASLPLKDRTYTADEDMRAVNPNRSKGKQYEQNDANCALAYDMRRRGFDVTAKGTNEPAGPEAFSEWYRDCKFTEIEQDSNAKGDYGSYAVSKVLSDLGQQPNGSYGMLYISWADGGGHAVTWAIENNKLVFRDCQSGKTIDLSTMANDISYMQYARTDNLKLTDKAMEAVESAKKDNDKSVVKNDETSKDTKSESKDEDDKSKKKTKASTKSKK